MDIRVAEMRYPASPNARRISELPCSIAARDNVLLELGISVSQPRTMLVQPQDGVVESQPASH